MYLLKYFLIFFMFSFSYAKELENISLDILLHHMLQKNIEIATSKENLNYNKMGVLVEKGQFDSKFNIQSGLSTDDTLSSKYQRNNENGLKKSYRTDSYNLGAGFEKLFEFGTTAKVSIDSSYAKSQSSRTNTARQPAFINNTISLSLDIPLLKNSGKEVVTYNVLMAKQNVYKAEYDLAHTISLSSSQVIQAYWNYLSSFEKLKIAVESEKLAKTILDNSKELIKNDIYPKSEIKSSLANFQSKKLQTLTAEDSKNRQWKSLIDTVGLSENFSNPLNPITLFPKQIKYDIFNKDKLFTHALNNRFDLKVQKAEFKRLDILKKFQHNQLRSDVQLQLGLDYKLLEQDDDVENMLDYYDGTKGNRIYANIIYRFNIDNKTAEGKYAQALSKQKNIILSQNNQKRSIKLAIVSSLDKLKTLSEQIMLSKETIKLYQDALENERKKYKLGISTINDIIDAQNDFVNSKTTRVNLVSEYAIALTELLYESGNLINKNTNNKYTILDSKLIKGLVAR